MIKLLRKIFILTTLICGEYFEGDIVSTYRTYQGIIQKITLTVILLLLYVSLLFWIAVDIVILPLRLFSGLCGYLKGVSND